MEAFQFTHWVTKIDRSAPALRCAVSQVDRPNTPEEVVRQCVLNYLLSIAKIRASAIRVEESLSHYKKGDIRRADIVVLKKNTPVLLVECKAEGVSVGDYLFDEQVNHYAEVLGFPVFIMLSNGWHNRYFIREDEQYKEIIELPVGLNERADIQYYAPHFKPWKSPSRDELFALQFQQQFYSHGHFEFGIHWLNQGASPTESIPFTIRLGEWLHFSPIAEGPWQSKNFTVLTDLGQAFRHFSNPSGDPYTSYFRNFKVVCPDGIERYVALGLIRSYRNTKIGIAFGLDGKGRSLSLQMDVEKNVAVDGATIVYQYKPNFNRGKQYLEESPLDYIHSLYQIPIHHDVLRIGMMNLNEPPNWSSTHGRELLDAFLTIGWAVHMYKEENARLKPKNTVSSPTRDKSSSPLSLARQSLKKGEYQKAFHLVIEQLPSAARPIDLWLVGGEAALKANKPKWTYELGKYLMEYPPKNFQYCMSIILQDFINLNTEESIQLGQQFVSDFPAIREMPLALYLMAIKDVEQEDGLAAMNKLLQALAQVPDSDLLRSEAIMVMLEFDLWDFEPAFKPYLSPYGEDFYLITYAEYLSRIGDLLGLTHLLQVGFADANYPSANAFRAYIALLEGKGEEAIAYFKKEEESYNWLHYWALAYWAIGEEKAALQLEAQAEESNPFLSMLMAIKKDKPIPKNYLQEIKAIWDIDWFYLAEMIVSLQQEEWTKLKRQIVKARKRRPKAQWIFNDLMMLANILFPAQAERVKDYCNAEAV